MKKLCVSTAAVVALSIAFIAPSYADGFRFVFRDHGNKIAIGAGGFGRHHHDHGRHHHDDWRWHHNGHHHNNNGNHHNNNGHDGKKSKKIVQN